MNTCANTCAEGMHLMVGTDDSAVDALLAVRRVGEIEVVVRERGLKRRDLKDALRRRLPDPVINLGGLQCIQYFQQCRLVQGYRALFPSAKPFAWVSLNHHTVAFHRASGTPSAPATYTSGGYAAALCLSV
jgi:hypothetical protein